MPETQIFDPLAIHVLVQKSTVLEFLGTLYRMDNVTDACKFTQPLRSTHDIQVAWEDLYEI